MAIKTFKWYLHEDDLWESRDEFRRVNPHLSDEEIELLINNNPFYEITVKCELDTETGRTRIVEATYAD